MTMTEKEAYSEEGREGDIVVLTDQWKYIQILTNDIEVILMMICVMYY